jgi:hypothetical protein
MDQNCSSPHGDLEEIVSKIMESQFTTLNFAQSSVTTTVTECRISPMLEDKIRTIMGLSPVYPPLKSA